MITNIFQIPIGKYSVEDWDTLNKTYALSQYANSFIEEINKDGRDGDNLYTDFQANAKYNSSPQYLQNMLSIITPTAQKFFDEVPKLIPQLASVDWTVNGAWFEKLTNNQLHGVHNHGSLGFSCVLYVDFDAEKHIPTTFISPHGDYIGGVTQMFCPEDIKSGDIIFFPSMLNHYAPKNLSDEERVIFSCNFVPIPQQR